MELVYYNANRNFTLQYQLVLSVVTRDDSEDLITQKIKAVSCFIDQYISRRVFNFKVVDYSTIKNAIFNLTKRFRKLHIKQLVPALQEELDSMEFTLEGIDRFHLNGFTSRYMLHILARITHYMDQQVGLNTRIEDYVNRETRNPYDIEHIWCDHFDLFKDQCEDLDDFEHHRDKFGALLILPRDKNRSYQDKTYEAKLGLYFGENMLCKTLCQECYRNNPQFLKFVAASGLPFQPVPNFGKAEIALRQNLYRQISKSIWGRPIAAVLD
jgi:hypothetical protein